jgi:hypothetical protein
VRFILVPSPLLTDILFTKRALICCRTSSKSLL